MKRCVRPAKIRANRAGNGSEELETDAVVKVVVAVVLEVFVVVVVVVVVVPIVAVAVLFVLGRRGTAPTRS
jgi:multidrug efflux pump subunit AcrB